MVKDYIPLKVLNTWVRKLIHVNDLSIELNRANALLFKMRKYVLKHEDPIFDSGTYPTALLSGLRIVALFSRF